MASRFPCDEKIFSAFEEACAKGESHYVAAKKLGTSLRALKDYARVNGESERYVFAEAQSQERRTALVDEVMDAVVLGPDATPSDRNIWAKANAAHYRDKSTLEITGTLNHEAKVVSLGDLLDAARESGLDLAELAGRPRRALPSAEDVLPASAEPEASAVPAERQA